MRLLKSKTNVRKLSYFDYENSRVGLQSDKGKTGGHLESISYQVLNYFTLLPRGKKMSF